MDKLKCIVEYIGTNEATISGAFIFIVVGLLGTIVIGLLISLLIMFVHNAWESITHSRDKHIQRRLREIYIKEHVKKDEKKSRGVYE